MVISKKTIIFKGFRGGPTFQGERATFSIWGGGGGGVQRVISIETYITCDFPGRGADPISPPLDPHMRFQTYFKRKH